MGRISTMALGIVFAVIGGGCSAPFPAHDVNTLRRAQLNPDEFKGTLLAFRGRVVETHRTDQGQVVQVVIHDDAIPELVYVVYPFKQNVDALNNDLVCVLGKGDGRVEGINGFGGLTSGVKLEGVAFHGARENSWASDWSATYDMWKAGTLFK